MPLVIAFAAVVELVVVGDEPPFMHPPDEVDVPDVVVPELVVPEVVDPTDELPVADERAIEF
ncbi:MAG TPA: hypothetical protein VGY55_11700 [Pirellulales bacterium]|nr:hypothetical protein [Pirellulales bacterium]